jgi:hypothetical protein
MPQIQSDIVQGHALDEAVRTVLHGFGKMIAVVPSEIDMKTGKVKRYLVVREGGPPEIALPQDR